MSDADRIAALQAEVDRLRSLLGPEYHVAEIRADGWSIKHPVSCREEMLDCLLHEVASHHWQEPPAVPGRYRADLDYERDVVVLSDLPEQDGAA